MTRRPLHRFWLAAALVAPFAVSGGFALVSAQAATGCTVAYTVTNQWPGGFGANVTVTNLGDAVSGWRLAWSFTAGQTITQLWNGSYSQSGPDVTVTNASWNAGIPTGGAVSFGFNAGSTGSNPVPAGFALNGMPCTGGMTGSSTPSASSSSPVPSPSNPSPSSPPPSNPPPAATFTNPVLWEDLADADVFRVGDAFYYTASTMHYSPGAPILRSYDLVHWEYVGHAVPSLDFDSTAYDLTGGRAYIKGIWASAMNYRRSNNTFYWLGCVEFNRTYVYTSTAVDSGWQKRSRINNCYYDAGLLIDDDDTMYVAYGNTTLSVAQLSADGLSEVRHQQVFQTPSTVGTLEGSRFYKRGNYYYIWSTKPANGQYVLRSTSPWGPYEMRQVLLNLPGPISGGGTPHQGGLVQTAAGDWYYMAFQDAYPGGRVPVLAPVTWTADGWPTLQTVNNAWGGTYPYPNLPRPVQTRPPTGTDSFTGSALGPEWEWNHNPDNARWSVGNGLKLQTATVTNDLYQARNTLTHRILGPTSTATIQLDYSQMKDGDRAGLAMLRHQSAWIGLKRDNGSTRLVMDSGLTMDGNWNTTGTGSDQAGTTVSGGTVWLRVSADIHPGAGRQARFSYSTDGTTFTPLGPAFTLNNDWQFFMGYRYAIFNYATQALGGSVTVASFTLSTP